MANDQLNVCKTLTDTYNNSSLVHDMVRKGASLSEIVVALVNQISYQNKIISDLMVICPKKIKLDDGRVMVWHCPDDGIPTDLPTVNDEQADLNEIAGCAIDYMKKHGL